MSGSTQATQTLHNFCSEHSIVSDIEVIPMEDVNAAYARVVRSDVKYRFVIVMASLK